MNMSNITNYKPKAFAELLGVTPTSNCPEMNTIDCR